jgi:hypothetical protein
MSSSFKLATNRVLSRNEVLLIVEGYPDSAETSLDSKK